VIRRRCARLLCLSVVVLGCAPATIVQVPPRPTSSADITDCEQATKLRDAAELHRGAGHVLRARKQVTAYETDASSFSAIGNRRTQVPLTERDYV
jgi:hypothetical protein